MVRKLDPIEVLSARAEARSYLWACGQYDLETAVEPLYLYAISSGLVAELGMDGVRVLIETAFDNRREP
jgi:hypothetical protein